MAHAARPTRTRRASCLATGLTVWLLSMSCGGGGTEPIPAVAGTYRLSGTATPQLTATPQNTTGPSTMRFDGTLTLTQLRTQSFQNLGGTATLTFTGGALGDATYVVTGKVSGSVLSSGRLDFSIGNGDFGMDFTSAELSDTDMSGTHYGHPLGRPDFAFHQGTWKATRQ